ncbi:MULTISPECIES: stage III sporulation protein AF [unclassified Peribacillus]|uniref:stage III sporulation protein AF n=1 Tax=unclassified Peribacillus TaxID=2675266 RepID=UPI001911BB50|nr:MULTISPECIES: stage III sporulation protein AF [unclassified Peribacillus]MBK5462749.1 stage III sporulation protein AF [Peribacillus sp. TH27]MBK5483913.1 stage III sporulation protein AF [Peribacillus sp. TH16]MBK5500900.1 stage III sporulation protein AF [Peribacillus sp. TH14]MBK5442505.1 stage III sporulation protein AF [Peribacillus sp. TH24]WMX54092.1 stage III sporulation protein AF [Peribacillus sp. R9-11]
MSFLAGWVSNIIVFVLLATVIDMLLPNSALQKYAKMVIGLLLIAIIITPILGLFNKDFDEILSAATSEFEDQKKKDLGNLTEMKKKEIQATQGAYILKQMAVELQAEVEEELMVDYNMKISSIDVGVKNEEEPSINDLQNITISLEKAEGKEDSEIEAVAKVDINAERPSSSNDANLDAVKRFLATSWSVDKEIIEIAGERK